MSEQERPISGQRQGGNLIQLRPESARPQGEAEVQIDLLELLYRILASWKMIAVIAVVCMIAAAVYSTSLVTPLYKATSSIYVIGRDSAINLSDLQLGSNMMSDYIKVFDMWEVHDEVIKNLKLNTTYTKMRNSLTINNTTGTHILDITFSSDDPQVAAAVANEYANVVSNYISDTMRMDKPSVMSMALTPTNAYNISLTRTVALGLILGLLMGCGIITLQYLLDDKVKTVEDVHRYTGLVNLAIVPMEESIRVNHTSGRKSRGGK